ncbi:hypothetical protein FJW10_09630 [Mesorhizobium sp. B4-1-1]|nr:hypothetical protein FJW10_09630 [Mesorhizobium sp. B4-1-1]
MIDVALPSVIRRWHLRDGFSIREIARRTGSSRNPIREYLRSDELSLGCCRSLRTVDHLVIDLCEPFPAVSPARTAA